MGDRNTCMKPSRFKKIFEEEGHSNLHTQVVLEMHHSGPVRILNEYTTHKWTIVRISDDKFDLNQESRGIKVDGDT